MKRANLLFSLKMPPKRDSYHIALTALATEGSTLHGEFVCSVLEPELETANRHRGNTYTVELGYNVMKGTEYSVSL